MYPSTLDVAINPATLYFVGKPDYTYLLGTDCFEKRDANSKYGARADPVGKDTNYRSNYAFSSPFPVINSTTTFAPKSKSMIGCRNYAPYTFD